MKKLLWECPHCGHPAGTRAEEHDRFDWMFEDSRHQKELWQCSKCAEYYFAYFELAKITAVKEAV